MELLKMNFWFDVIGTYFFSFECDEQTDRLKSSSLSPATIIDILFLARSVFILLENRSMSQLFPGTSWFIMPVT